MNPDALSVMQVVADGEPGGGTTMVLGLSAELIGRGIPTVCVSAPNSYALDAARERGIVAEPCELFGGRAAAALRSLRRIAGECRPSIIHLHGSRAGLIGAVAFRTPPRRRTVYTVHGIHSLARHQPWRAIGGWGQRLAHRLADEVVWVSETDREVAVDAGWLPSSRGRVIRNGIDLGSLPSPGRATPGEVAFLGRLTHPKNPGFMLDLARNLADEGYKVRLIGGGDEEAELRRRISDERLSDTVSVTGALPRTDALCALRTASLLVLPSHWEGYPTAPLEAMALSVPVLGSRVRGVTAVIEHERNGLLFEPGDVAGCAELVRALDADPSRRARIIDGGRTTARAHTQAAMADAYLNVYREVIERAGG
jgi:glycosyltransferase involved in cell wall biosynthesis